MRSLVAPDHVLALGVVIKGEGSTYKVRVIVYSGRGAGGATNHTITALPPG